MSVYPFMQPVQSPEEGLIVLHSAETLAHVLFLTKNPETQLTHTPF